MASGENGIRAAGDPSRQEARLEGCRGHLGPIREREPGSGQCLEI